MLKPNPVNTRILSGIQPTGVLHIGNYLGAMIQFVELQKKYQCFFMVADLHALTVNPDPKDLTKQILDVIRLYLAAGIDPNQSTIFIQSQVHEHTELAWILSNYTAVGELDRMTQFKEKSDLAQSVNAGLFIYPILMAADILLYQAGQVPVGEDQVQHLELTRKIARRFNSRHGQVFIEPEPLTTQHRKIMALNDPTKKMSKSRPGSYIALTDSAQVIHQKVMSAVTDSGPVKTGFSKGMANLFELADYFMVQKSVADFRQRYESGTLQYRDFKEQLAEAIIKKIKPIQDKSQTISDREILNIAARGAKRAREIAAQTLAAVKAILGLRQGENG